jgi:hypothetical protein
MELARFQRMAESMSAYPAPDNTRRANNLSNNNNNNNNNNSNSSRSNRSSGSSGRNRDQFY